MGLHYSFSLLACTTLFFIRSFGFSLVHYKTYKLKGVVIYEVLAYQNKTSTVAAWFKPLEF